MRYLHDTKLITESNICTPNGIYTLPPFEDGVLYITDSPSIAETLISKEYPTVIYSHPGNRNQTFPHTKYVLEDIDDIDDEDLENIYRRTANIPWDILETDRLLIRETTLDDIDTLISLYSDPSITEYMENLFPKDEEIEYQRKYIENIYGLYDIGMWSIIRKSDHQLIGRIGIEYKDDSEAVEMGFMLGKDYQNKGYATEAGIAVLKYASSIENIKRVTALVHKDNLASNRLCKRLGMNSKTVLPTTIVWEYLCK